MSSSGTGGATSARGASARSRRQYVASREPNHETTWLAPLIGVGQRGRRRRVHEEGLEAEAVERARLLRHAELDEQAREPRLAHEGDRRGGRHRAQAAQRGHRLEHVAQRARVNDQESGFHLTSRVAARSIQPP